MKRKRSRRWLRIAIPLAVVSAVFIATGIIHAIQQADPGDKDYLNPDSQAPIGSSHLAQALRDQGITVQRVTSTYEASTTLWAEPQSTLLVTAPGYTDVEHLGESRWYPPGSQIVLVRPDDGFLQQTDWPTDTSTAGERWTASAPAPGCDLFTTPAAVHKRYYDTTGTSCYQGGVVQLPVHTASVTLVGADDPFRNDRLGEHGNRAFALSLLDRRPQVIWLDLHKQDRWPTSDGVPVTDRPAPDGPGGTAATPEDTTDDYGDSDTSQDGQTGSGDEEQQQQQQPEREHHARGARPQTDTFPAKVWAIVLLVLLAAAAFAAASARRLGTPVAERLPSRVPANETMLGHARLYQRGGSRGPSLDILRQHARRRITDHLGLPPAATDEALAAASGLPVERFTEVFSSDRRLKRDADLVAATKQLQDLMRDVMNEGETQ
ncbi:DUF4350 domain-containing protein [Actinoplanes sp. TBRC 11911]|uniref:DUF4350 domain-containing protein n=1 Tax=Actinoplanes sp. TBRC 11911 TaxID=2729386 RepID=UPI00145E272F|nr:DUF4350 domain-containing protein [Actinoplanes sp. TBRC 11911]NMO54864.1 DUF4350 domain-containing protein [Actinoplanes sp. TBRC 11911]